LERARFIVAWSTSTDKRCSNKRGLIEIEFNLNLTGNWLVRARARRSGRGGCVVVVGGTFQATIEQVIPPIMKHHMRRIDFIRIILRIRIRKKHRITMFNPRYSAVVRMCHANRIRLIRVPARVVHPQDIVGEFDDAGSHYCVVTFPWERCG